MYKYRNWLVLSIALVSLFCASCNTKENKEEKIRKWWCGLEDKRPMSYFSENFEPAEKHDGSYSLHEYSFKGKGSKHSKEEVEKYELYRNGSCVNLEWKIEWPEEKCGLTTNALEKVRRNILWMALTDEDPSGMFERYPQPELDESDKPLIEFLNHVITIDYEGSSYGSEQSSPFENAIEQAAKNGENISCKCFELVKEALKKYALKCYECNATGAYHYCSQWDFCTEVSFSWPFGLTKKPEAKWYEQPVMVYKQYGWVNDGGEGEHGNAYYKTFSLPDGRELGVLDYFDEDKLQDLTDLVWRRLKGILFEPYNNKDEQDQRVLKEVEEEGIDLTDECVLMVIMEEGVEWTWQMNSLFPPWFHFPSVFIKWQDLEEFKKDGSSKAKTKKPDEEEKVEREVSENTEPASQHDGMYSVYEYSFKGKGREHTKKEKRKYCISNSEGCCFPGNHSEVEAKWHVEWPYENSGLTSDALAKVRKAILCMAFASEEEVLCEYIESEDTDRWKERYEDNTLSISDMLWLVLSQGIGKTPMKDDGRVSVNPLEVAMEGLKEHAESCLMCTPMQRYHQCSHWNFTADVRLKWPFGTSKKEGGKWYEKPILCVEHYGYSNDGGHGCHSFSCSEIYSLPDGIELKTEDFFAEDKLEELKLFVLERLIKELNMDFEEFQSNYIVTSETGWEEKTEELVKKDFSITSSYVTIQVNEQGMEWIWNAYYILPGAWGMPSVFIKWEDLEPFKK